MWIQEFIKILQERSIMIISFRGSGLNFLAITFGMLSLLFLGLFGHSTARADWKREWEKTLNAAREEGRVFIYGTRNYDLLFSEFQKKYPGIKVHIATGSATEIVQRLMAERRANKYLRDLYFGAVTVAYKVLYKGKVLSPITPTLILPEVVDRSKWWGGKHRYLDDEGKYIFKFNAQIQSYFTYNTKLVNPNTIKSYWDLLDPKWKGKMVVVDPTTSSAGNPLRLVFYNPELGSQYLRRLLTEMDLTPSRDFRQMTDWLATGKFVIGIFTNANRMRLSVAKKQGLPVDWFGPKSFKEGTLLSSITGNAGIINRAPHPNAAKVVINWVLSREGQIAYQRIFEGPDSLRIDIPKDDVPPHTRRLGGIKYVITDLPERMDMKPIRKTVNEVWKRKR